MLKVTVYQIQGEKMEALYGDPRGAFEGFESRKKFYPHMFDKNGDLKMDAYVDVFDMNIDGYVFFYDVRKAVTTAGKLEALFRMFNNERECETLRNSFGFTGYSMSVGTVVRIEQSGEETFHYCDNVGWLDITPVNVPLGFKVGDGATLFVGSDCYPYHISRISPSGKTVWVKRADYTRTDSNGFSESQEYEITPREDASEEKITYSKKYGKWMSHGRVYSLKFARAYQDPSF